MMAKAYINYCCCKDTIHVDYVLFSLVFILKMMRYLYFNGEVLLILKCVSEFHLQSIDKFCAPKI